MGTRSRIGIAIGVQVVSVYCHYDGYIQHNRRKLVEKFNTAELVHELINGRDMSSLDSTHTWESAPLKQIILKTDDDGKYTERLNIFGTLMTTGCILQSKKHLRPCIIQSEVRTPRQR